MADVDHGGLTSVQAASQMKKWGKNELIDPNSRLPCWRVFAMQFFGTMAATIGIAGLLSAAIGLWVVFWIIAPVLMVNAIIGFMMDMSAQSTTALKDGMVRKLPVKRDGQYTQLNIVDLVPGDIIFLRGGNMVPADAKWIEGDELVVEEAARSYCYCVPREDSEADGELGSGKRLFSGSIIKTGECEALVTETGYHTVLGKECKHLQRLDVRCAAWFRGTTRSLTGAPGEGKIMMTVRTLIMLTLIAVGCQITFHVGLRHAPLVDCLEMAISITIASVPLALPMVIHVILSVGANESAKKGATLKKEPWNLPSLETIASIDVICCEKTGIITDAKMAVYPQNTACFNGFTGEEVIKMAALASNPADSYSEDVMDAAIYRAYTLSTSRSPDMLNEGSRMPTMHVHMHA